MRSISVRKMIVKCEGNQETFFFVVVFPNIGHRKIGWSPRYVLIYISAGIAGALFHSVIASYILGTDM
jgi:hypothetical protein